MEAKHLIVENGVLKVTDKPMPKAPDAWDIIASRDALPNWDNALESWKQEALVVENAKQTITWLYVKNCFNHSDWIGIELKDGLYDAPAGLEYEVIGNPTMIGDCKYELANEEKFAILSFASPKEEAPIINKLEETIVEWLKSGDENATNLAYQIFFKHIERKEAPASKEKPDFYSLLSSLVTTYQQDIEDWGIDTDKLPRKALKTIVDKIDYQNECLKTLAVGLRASYELKIAALQEEIRQIKNKQ